MILQSMACSKVDPPEWCTGTLVSVPPAAAACSPDCAPAAVGLVALALLSSWKRGINKHITAAQTQYIHDLYFTVEYNYVQMLHTKVAYQNSSFYKKNHN